jgi:hypothetical protein|nr:MAG TPA: hypothetical protein [Caudoviricetes sp.]
MEFKPGNIVKMIDTYWHGSLNESRKDIGKLFVIEYSYGEKYGNGKCYGGYSILSMENGSSSSWWDDSQLEFVEDGNIDLIDELKRKYEEIANQAKDIKWIKEHFSKNLPTDSILTLFHKIGYNSAFEQNGEFYCLTMDWLSFYPAFLLLFGKEFDLMIKLLDGGNRKDRDKYLRNFTALYNEIHGTDKKVGE